MKKRILVPVLVGFILVIGGTIFSPSLIKADTNMVLASVQWVQAQLNPLQTKMNQLETKIAQQEQQIKSLQDAVKAGGTTPNPTPPGGVVSFPATVYTTKSNVTVHSGATKSYKVIATFPAGKALTATEEFKSSTGIWYRVNVTSSVKGWIYTADVTTEKPSNFVPSQVVAKNSTNIRSGATTQYNVVEFVPSGTSMKYLGVFKNASGETWYNVQTPKGNKGWVLSTLTEVK
ncbi:SH3 domain-containing protein [Paenisporosarcina sp. NPDC076898]|uniref:SH3 domain-containing protein n=1 Tax=unclassified Paenisporosarcina TaxID=2642018 RepID=UPI003D023368